MAIELEAEIESRRTADRVFDSLAVAVFGVEKADEMKTVYNTPTDFGCMREVFTCFLQFKFLALNIYLKISIFPD